MKKLSFTFFLFGIVAAIFPKVIYGCGMSDTETALGCIPNDPIAFTVWILARALGIGGGIAFLLMVSGAIKILTSAGNPEGVKNGTQTILSAVQGLLFIIFSLFLLKLIGVDILQIPGFFTKP